MYVFGVYTTYVRMSWVHGYQKKVSRSINVCLISLNISKSLTKPGARFSGLVRPNDPPASTPTPQGWGYMHSLFLYLMWVLWIQTQVLLFGQQARTNLSHLPSPLSNFWQDQNLEERKGEDLLERRVRISKDCLRGKPSISVHSIRSPILNQLSHWTDWNDLSC